MLGLWLSHIVWMFHAWIEVPYPLHFSFALFLSKEKAIFKTISGPIQQSKLGRVTRVTITIQKILVTRLHLSSRVNKWASLGSSLIQVILIIADPCYKQEHSTKYYKKFGRNTPTQPLEFFFQNFLFSFFAFGTCTL